MKDPRQNNIAGKGFDKNPQNINRKGRPRKTYTVINDIFKDKGIQPVSKSEYIELFSRIMNATEAEINTLKSDKNTPLALRIILAELSSKNKNKIIRDLRNFMFGQSQQEIIQTVKARVITQEEIKRYKRILEDEN
ncbi:hypothetical protein G6R40_01190 [Chryseobacterium sp. POL2]|uniref:hypothetical protein n=1 Tax=Chryseobacterium sp. POL2 TaxID=2713414 RepID=UPI0013E0EB62|nr:hypothetical protein [Chryseobacterium sp. POL2]QIG88353.1 hypothetical protein G6R40_01190 [Chryseobacterium sp. POL2]